MIKLYIEGFRGPWGWVPEYEKWISGNPAIIMTPPEIADVIFQCDPSNWRENQKYLGDKLVIANVLDFADWLGGNPDIEEYVDKFCRNAYQVTAISNKVMNQLRDRDIDSTMFYYPSQVSNRHIRDYRGNVEKKKRMVSFCRLGDPGKQIKETVDIFLKSDLPAKGWEYWLIGPEAPTMKISKPIKYFGYMDKDALMGVIASSCATLMPSLGEGLGLPAIESTLLGTYAIARHIEPMKSVLGYSYLTFTDDLISLLNELGEDYEDSQQDWYFSDVEHLVPWIREVAFQKLTEHIYGLWKLRTGLY